MATTPNFNWSTPDNTGLVKNGALDIRTLGNAIDASMADLKGGTTGQVLAKATNTDMDFTWVAPTTGDITEVIAGTGLTGGGTSGAVTLALNSSSVISPTIVDAAGDLIIGTAADTVGRLAIGTNGQILTSNGTTATWTTPAGGGGAVVQVKGVLGSTTTSTTSSTFVDAATTLSITPTSASNKIVVAFTVEWSDDRNAYDADMSFQIVRGSTVLDTYGPYLYMDNGTYRKLYGAPATLTNYDSPATTSSITYKIRLKQNGGSGTAYMTVRSITLMEVTP